MTWAAWVLVICIAASILCLLVGVVRAIGAARVVKKHADALQASPLLADASKAEGYATRINDDLAQIERLLARANAAIASLNASLRQMRIPEAVAAVRTAGAAIRLLFSGR